MRLLRNDAVVARKPVDCSEITPKPEHKATIGRILRDNGYATSWLGNDHNLPRTC
jgi:arylsulfatase A-like enzyme